MNLKVLKREDMIWYDGTWGDNAKYVQIADGGTIPEWNILAVDPVSEIPENSFFYGQPDVFDVIITSYALINAGWKLDRAITANGDRKWTHPDDSSLLAYETNGIVYAFCGIRSEACSFFWSQKYNKFVAYWNFRYQEMYQTKPERRTAIEKYRSIFEKLYGGCNENPDAGPSCDRS